MGKPIKPPLTPIPIKGPFDRFGVDVIKFPRSARGNKYAVVFMDYLTKWPEVFATRDQTSLTIAELLVEKVISRHGVPAELLSDRGQVFLSRLMVDVYGLLGIRKANTTAYHPQTDGLVERFHQTLMDMLAKKVKRTGRDWDDHLPYVLFSTGLASRHPHARVHFICFMGGILYSQEMQYSLLQRIGELQI